MCVCIKVCVCVYGVCGLCLRISVHVCVYMCGAISFHNHKQNHQVPVPERSQRGQSGVPVASDQRWSRAATHQGKWCGGPSETQISSNLVNSES